MKETFNTISATALIGFMVLMVVLSCTVPSDADSQIGTEVIETTQPLVTETVQPTVAIPEETVEETQPIVNNPVNDVNNSVQVPTVSEPSYTDEQLEILALIIYQEAGADACSDDTRRKVGSVFLNRVNSPFFPDTFEEVATQKRQYGLLYLTGIKWPDRASTTIEAHAVQRAYNIAKELLIGGSILPSNVIWQAEFIQGDGTYCYQDNIYFCYSEVSE